MHASRFVALSLLTLAAIAGCTTRTRPDDPDTGGGLGTDTGTGIGYDAGPGHDLGLTFADMGTGNCMGGSCYTVYAHSDHVLYSIDLTGHSIVRIGAFQSGSNTDTMTDLAVASDGTIYVISHTTLYTADPNTGAATMVASLASCGTETVALSFAPDGFLYAGDFNGAFCRIDISNPSAPTVVHTTMLSGGYALSGDIVVVSDGTMFGTVYHLSDAANTGSQLNNILAQIDPATGTVTPIGATNYGKLFGVAYQDGQVFGFTHGMVGSAAAGTVVTIDRMTGVGTVFGVFSDPMTHSPISFAGAGVNVNVPIAPM